MGAFSSLSERLNHIFSKLTKRGRLTELEIKTAMREVRVALLEADVNVKVAKQFCAEVSEKAVGQEIIKSLNPAQQVIKIVNDELIALMGSSNQKLAVSPKPPTVIMMCGLQGAGKTTLCGKLAVNLKKSGKKPLLVACDIYRPAAINQLKVVGKNAGAEVFEKGTQNPVTTARQAVEHAKSMGFDTVIIDTAGRLEIDEALMQELENIKKGVEVTEILLTVDSMMGQAAVNVAKTFNERLEVTGIILTKLDGDTRGGAALTIRSVVHKPIKFVGTGETLDGIDTFHPDRMANRILGMGDIVSLVEKAQQQFDEKEAEEIAKKFRRNQFTFNDFIKQIQQVKKMGNIKDLAAMIPGVGKAIKDIDIDDNAFKSVEAIIMSMTPYEREHPEVLNAGSRRQRIARGSGTTPAEVNRLLKQFDQMRKMMQQVTSMKNPMAMMRGMRGMRR